MILFIEYPLLALLFAAFFAALYRNSSRTIALSVAVLWAVYGVYEFAMRQRWICSGECNIRVDLLMIYPVLAGLSVAALVSFAREVRRRRERDGG